MTLLQDAVVNVSTSAQMAFVQPDGFQPSVVRSGEARTSTENFPYFEVRGRVRGQNLILTAILKVNTSSCTDVKTYHECALITQGRYIAVAASLTGGNALATFVRMIQLWCMELGCSVPQVGDQKQSDNVRNVIRRRSGPRPCPPG